MAGVRALGLHHGWRTVRITDRQLTTTRAGTATRFTTLLTQRR